MTDVNFPHTQPNSELEKNSKILYKNQKRKTRNRLIYLVGFHIFLIFCFVGFVCC